MAIQSKSVSRRVFQIGIFIVLMLFALVCIYPFYYIIIYSVSDPAEVGRGVYFLPQGFSLLNYQQIFQQPGIFQALVISILRTVVGMTVTVVCCSMFAYLVSKPEMPARRLIYRLTVMTMYLSSGMIPMYLTIKSYGLRNNFLVYILPMAISAYNVVLLKTYIEQLPPSLEEAAKLDGAGYFTVFTRIIFPLSKPIVATIALFAAVNQWNSWFDNKLYCTSGELRTLQLLLYNFLNEAQAKANSMIGASSSEIASAMEAVTITPEGVRMTITVLAIVPIFLVYPFLQKHFSKGIMMGAVKG